MNATDGAGNTTTATRSYTVYADPRPDAAIKRPGAPYVGNDRCSPSARQRVSATISKPGNKTKFVVKVWNRGGKPEALTWRVKYSSKRFRVTSPRHGQTPVREPGQRAMFRASVLRRGRLRPGGRRWPGRT